MYYKKKINFESLLGQPDLADAAKKVEDDVKVDVAKKETPDLPVPMELNPIDADQAIEIANNHPTEKEIDGLTTYEQVLQVASDIDNNNIKAVKDYEQGNMFASIAKMPNPIDAYDSIKETEKYFDLKSNITLSKEDIESHPDEARNIIASELQAIQNKANNSSNGTWATIKEDCENIRTLIKKALDFITSKQPDLNEAIDNINKGRLVNYEVELAPITEYVGNLRHFLTPYKGKGSLIELTELLKMIMIEQSPYLTSSDNKIIKDIANNESGSLQKIINYVSNAINTDPLNVKLKVKAANNPLIEDYAIYGRLTGTTGVEVLTRTLEHKKLPLSDKNKYTKYLINTSEIDTESYKDDLILALRNFETKFKNLFVIYIKKYEEIEKNLKPILMEGEVETVPEKSDLLLQALRIARFFYIELVKDRIIDKLNAYIGLIELCKLAFTQKEKINTEDSIANIDIEEISTLEESIDVINGVLNNVGFTDGYYNELRTNANMNDVDINVGDGHRLASLITYKDGLYVKDTIFNILVTINNSHNEEKQPYKYLPFGPYIKYYEKPTADETDENKTVTEDKLIGLTLPNGLSGWNIQLITNSICGDGTSCLVNHEPKTLSNMDVQTNIIMTKTSAFRVLDNYRKNISELSGSINGIIKQAINTTSDYPDLLQYRVKQIADLLRDYEEAVNFLVTKTLQGGK